MKRFLFILCLTSLSCPPAAVTSSAPPPTSKPPFEQTEQTELEALLLSVPPRCASLEPLDTVACPPTPREPPGACVVERHDTKSKRLTDRLVYSGQQLVSDEHIVSSHTRAITTLTWDEQQRVEEKTTCLSAGAGEPEWAPAWRPPMAVYEQAMTQHSRTRITYDGDSTRPAFAQVDSSSGENSSRMKLCYAYDEQGHRARRIRTYRDQTPASVQIESRKYAWADQRLASIDVRSVALKERSLAGKSQHRVTFDYDQDGRVTGHTVTRADQPPSSVKLTWEDGRLVSYADLTFQWDERGHLIGLLDGRFEWDASGRITSATFENGEGFMVTYSPTCPAGFSPPPVTPSVDAYLFYEGKDEL